MANIRLSWVVPTTRVSTKPLDPASLAGIEIAVSADDGVTYVVADMLPANSTETLFTDMEIGIWKFRGVVVDLAGRRSIESYATAEVLDTTPPNGLNAFEAVLA